MVRLITFLPLAVAAVLAAVFAWALYAGRDPSVVPSPLIDKPVPTFRLPSLDGSADLTQAEFQGRVTVLNVFASWCLPCRAEHPALTALARDGKARIIGLNHKDKPEDAKAWLKELGSPYTRIGADRTGRAAIEWGVYGVPETFVIDKAGRIRHKLVGPITPEQLKVIRRKIGQLAK
ncbi:MAG: DsbE family thiol:disulfide interchange protein [Alphaproteobacteria bacterium]